MELAKHESIPALAKFKVKEKIASNEDKSILKVEDDKGSLYVLKAFQKTYKYPLYVNLSKLVHENMPQIHEVHLQEDCFYVVEDYVEGATLKETLEVDGALDKRDTLNVLMQLCDVLMYLHNQQPQIIHRDITPANIIVTKDGVVKLLDFDIAREYKNEAPKDTEFIGTKPFAPPEQYGFSQSDHRTDIYSLGMLITVLLTNTYEVQRIKDLQFRNIAERCMQLSPGKRFQNVKKLKYRLERLKDNRYSKLIKIAGAIGVLAISTVIAISLLIYRGDDHVVPYFVNVQATSSDVYSGWRTWVNVSGGTFDGYDATMIHLNPEYIEVMITSDPPAYDTFILLDSRNAEPPHESFIFTPIEVSLDSGNSVDRTVTVTVRYLDFERIVSFPVLSYGYGVGVGETVVITRTDGAEPVILTQAAVLRYAEAGLSLQFVLVGGTVLVDADAVHSLAQNATHDRIEFELVSHGGELEFVVSSGGQILADLDGEIRIIQPITLD